LNRLAAIALLLSLSGCSVTPAMIKSDTMGFDDAIEDTTNKLLLINVLRARDNAPLHFADIPVIRQSMQASASVGALNFLGGLANTTTRDSMTMGASLQKSPNFEVTHLGSKEFNTGMASPIDPKIVKYWLDRGLDRRIVLLLFFSAAEIVETRSEQGPVNTIRILNSPRQAIDTIVGRKEPLSPMADLRCDGLSDFERYLKLLNSLSTFFAHSYRERRLLAKGMRLDPEKDSRGLQSFAMLDQTKTQLVLDPGGSTYSLYAMSSDPKVAFCFFEENDSTAEFIAAGMGSPSNKRSCFQSVVDIAPEDTASQQVTETRLFFQAPRAVIRPTPYCAIYNRFTGASTATPAGVYPRLQLRLHIRSVGEMFQFLGDLLQYQDEIRRHLERNRGAGLKLNTPLTFGYCGDAPVPGCDDIFFRLDGDPCNARFVLDYRDRQYAVANFGSSADAAGSACSPGLDPAAGPYARDPVGAAPGRRPQQVGDRYPRDAHGPGAALIMDRTEVSGTFALLLTDVVDSTKLAEAMGAAATATLWAAHDRCARDLLPVWRGREIDKTDGMLLLFDAAATRSNSRLRITARSRAPPAAVRARRPARRPGGAAREQRIGHRARRQAARARRRGEGARGARDVDRGRRPDAPVRRRAKDARQVTRRIDRTVTGGSRGSPSRSSCSKSANRRAVHPSGRCGEGVPRRLAGRRLAAGAEHPQQPAGRARHVRRPARDAGRSRAAIRRRIATGVGARHRRHRQDASRHALRLELDGRVSGRRLVLRPVAGAQRRRDRIRRRAGSRRPAGKGDPVAQLGHAIAGRGHCLMILDNFEQVARHAEETLGHWHEPRRRRALPRHHARGARPQGRAGAGGRSDADGRSDHAVRASRRSREAGLPPASRGSRGDQPAGEPPRLPAAGHRAGRRADPRDVARTCCWRE
jgi:hypothetical protein